MLQRAGDHVQQYGGGLVGRLTVLDVREHASNFVVITPGHHLFQPVEAVAEPRLAGGEILVADAQPVTDALPEGSDGALLHVAQRAPFVHFDEPHGLDGEKAERVQHVVFQDFARGAVPAVQEAGARDGDAGAL